MANASERAQSIQTILNCYRLCLECARECTSQAARPWLSASSSAMPALMPATCESGRATGNPALL
jgi:hypothetical protein